MEKKRIKILTQGAIRVKGFINGPVLTPYFEDISTIFAMISAGIHIVEVCDNGKEVRLTTSNFDKDNTKKNVKPKEIKKEIEQPVVEETHTTETVEEVKKEEQPVAKEEIKPIKETPKSNYNKKYDRYNKKNNTKENKIRVESADTETIKLEEK